MNVKFMMRLFVPFVVMIILFAVTTGQAQDKPKAAVKETTITGEVVDVSCYLGHGARGEGHKECAEMCAKAGGPLGILTSDGKLYISLMPENHIGGPNDKLMGFIAQNVTVKGVIHSKTGVNGVVVKEVMAAK